MSEQIPHLRDRSRVDLSEDYERYYWTREFGVTEGELEEAVHAVGDWVEKVREHLSRPQH